MRNLNKMKQKKWMLTKWRYTQNARNIRSVERKNGGNNVLVVVMAAPMCVWGWSPPGFYYCRAALLLVLALARLRRRRCWCWCLVGWSKLRRWTHTTHTAVRLQNLTIKMKAKIKFEVSNISKHTINCDLLRSFDETHDEHVCFDHTQFEWDNGTLRKDIIDTTNTQKCTEKNLNKTTHTDTTRAQAHVWSGRVSRREWGEREAERMRHHFDCTHFCGSMDWRHWWW